MNGCTGNEAKRLNWNYQAKPKGMTRGRSEGNGLWANESKSRGPQSRGPGIRGKREGPFIKDRPLMARPRFDGPKAYKYRVGRKKGNQNGNAGRLSQQRSGIKGDAPNCKGENPTMQKIWRVKEVKDINSANQSITGMTETSRSVALPGIVIKERKPNRVQESIKKGKSKKDAYTSSEDDEENESWSNGYDVESLRLIQEGFVSGEGCSRAQREEDHQNKIVGHQEHQIYKEGGFQELNFSEKSKMVGPYH